MNRILGLLMPMKISYLIWTVAAVTVIGGAVWYAQLETLPTSDENRQLLPADTSGVVPVSTESNAATAPSSPTPARELPAVQPKRPLQAPPSSSEAKSSDAAMSTPSMSTTSTSTASSTPSPGGVPAEEVPSSAPPPPPEPRGFTVNTNDGGADLTDISVPKGTPVTLTFKVNATGTYYGGLEFRSSVVSTGSISPGAEETVQFTADTPFSFTPYWPASNVVKPYRINIIIREAATSTAGETFRATDAISSQTTDSILSPVLGAQTREICWSIINGKVFNPAASGWTTQRTFATRQKQFFNLQCKTPGTNQPSRHVRQLLFR